MTRPRSNGSAASWSVEFTPAANVTETAPSGTSAATWSGSTGATAAASSTTPPAAAAPTSRRGETRLRAPAARPPHTRAVSGRGGAPPGGPQSRDPAPLGFVSGGWVGALPTYVGGHGRG